MQALLAIALMFGALSLGLGLMSLAAIWLKKPKLAREMLPTLILLSSAAAASSLGALVLMLHRQFN